MFLVHTNLLKWEGVSFKLAHLLCELSLLLLFVANTEANERRIRNVENCFGASGQVSCLQADVDVNFILQFLYCLTIDSALYLCYIL